MKREDLRLLVAAMALVGLLGALAIKKADYAPSAFLPPSIYPVP